MGWKDDGIHKRGRYYYIGWTEDKRYREKSAHTTDYAEAREFLRKHREAMKQQQLPNNRAKWPLSKAIETFNKYRLGVGGSEGTAKREARLLIRVMEFFGKDTPLSKVADLRRFQAYQVHRRGVISPTMKQPVQPRTINYELWLLRKVLEDANLWTGELANKYKRLKQPPRSVGQVLSPDQGLSLFEVARSKQEWYVAFLGSLLAYFTGRRKSEIRTLRLRDIDPEFKFYYPHRDYVKNRKPTPVALNAPAKWAMQRIVERARLIGSTQPDHYLFPHCLAGHTKAGDPEKGKTGFDPTRPQTTWDTAWRAIRKAAGLPRGFRFHDLRHTFNTQGFKAGVPLEELMCQVGHVDPEIAREYLHLAFDSAEKAAKAVEKANPALIKLLGLKPEDTPAKGSVPTKGNQSPNEVCLNLSKESKWIN